MELCISENLRLLRSRFGYTLEGLAEIMGVTRQSVAKWEAGESSPDIANCVKLSALFKITLDEFVTLPLAGLMKEDKENQDRIMGVTEVDAEGKVRIPDKVLELFEIEKGGKVLLLADKNQGMAIVKCSQLD